MLDGSALTQVFNAYPGIFTTGLLLAGGIWMFYLGYLRGKRCRFISTSADCDNFTGHSAVGSQRHMEIQNVKNISNHVGKSDVFGPRNPRSVKYIRVIFHELIISMR